MHIYWTGLAADLWRAGDKSLVWILEEAANGRGVRGRSRRTRQRLPAARVDDAAPNVSTVATSSTGHKMFGSLTPVWTRLGIHGMDTSDPENPKVVHAFMPRDTDGYRIEATWDTLGMRGDAQRRHDPRGRVRPRQVRRTRATRPGSRARTRSCSACSPGRSARSAACTSGSRATRARSRRPPTSRRRRRSRSTGRRWRGTRRTSGWSRRCSSTSKARPRTSNASRRTGPTASITAACGRRSSCRRSTTRSKRRSASSIGRWT